MTILYLDRDTMGSGDLELGKKLTIAFLKQIIEEKVSIDAVFCVNHGAFLTTKNEDSIALLKQIESQGAVVSTCGTCLEFFELKNCLQVGEMGSMKWFVSLLKKADKVIRM